MTARNGDFSDWRDAKRQPHPDLRPGHDPARRQQAAVPGQHHPGRPVQPRRPGVPAVPADAHQRRRAQQLPRAERGPRLDPRRQQLLLRPLRLVHRPERPHLDLPVAPARRHQVQLAPAASSWRPSRPRTPRTRRSTASTGTTPSGRTCSTTSPSATSTATRATAASTPRYVDDLPKIQGVVSNLVPSPMSFSDGYNGFGCGGSLEADSITTRPTYVVNDLVTFIKGNHTIKIGGEYRNIGGNTPQPDERAGLVQLRPRGHRDPGRQQRQPDRQLPPRRGGQRQPGRAHGVERLPAAARLDLPRRRHLDRHRQADAELRPALGLLLALEREVRPPRVPRPHRRQPVGRRPPRQPGVRGQRVGRGELRRALPGEGLVRGPRPAPRRSPTRSTARPSSAPDGASSTIGPSSPAGAAA